MKISFAGFSVPKRATLVLLASEGPKFGDSAAAIDGETDGLVSRACKAADFKGKNGSFAEILAPSGVTLDRILVAGIGDPEKLGEDEWVNLGGAIAGRLSGMGVGEAAICCDVAAGEAGAGAVAARIALGARLRTYRFDRYRSKASESNDRSLAKVTVQVDKPAAARKAYATGEAVADGVHFARDLVNEPPNVLHPAEFAKRLKALTKLGMKVDVLGQKDLEKLKMGALLSVAEGSRRDAQVVVMVHEGGGNEAPVAFVGKGVTFDTGGVSLKPAGSMGDMKGDMAGAGCVAGLMKALAARKAKVNAVGIVGLVENMPDGRALRPGDVVTSMSGQTIEVLNTDAEGRLVLADVIHYVRERFEPRAMVDLATLTGAIVVALGKHNAGLFANDDDLADGLIAAGMATGERVWRMPLAREYDKMIDSRVADMKNIGGRSAGSVTAAQFLQRFVGDTPWAHLDIAGTAFDAGKSDVNTSWGSGFGVRLLDRLVAERYERR